jgi:catechol 2,3-dioxygenase-like lactoylglutathione lyase family enzyme
MGVKFDAVGLFVNDLKEMVGLGAKPVYYPKTEQWGMRSSYIADPDGNLIEIGSWGKGEK